MTDVFSKRERSEIMRAVHGKDTSPEKKVRALIYKTGFRYRLHSKTLPGKPDLVFPSKRKVIFVHGCFWHGHSCTRGKRIPKTNTRYWLDKIKKNKIRDRTHIKDLTKMGWKSFVIWECQLKNMVKIANEVKCFLE